MFLSENDLTDLFKTINPVARFAVRVSYRYDNYCLVVDAIYQRVGKARE